MMRTIWALLHIVLATAILGPTAIFLGLTGWKRPLLYRLSEYWCRWALWATGVTLYVEGIEHLALDRPQIVISNHQSWFDIFAIGAAMPKHPRFVGKKELDRIPVFGRAWIAAGHISIDRSNRAAAIESLRTAETALRSDNSAVIIFPEGTRSPDGALLPFKKGAFMLALETGVEVVPTAVIGSRDVMPKGTLRVRSHPIILRFGAPVEASQYAQREDFIEDVRRRIDGLLTSGRAEAQLAAASADTRA